MIRGGELRLLTQPDNDLLMESLLLLCDDNIQTKVTQIICLEAGGGRDGCRNLENIRRILRYGVGIRRYEPRYYYGRPAEHYGVMNVMPYLVVTDRCAVQISSDWKAAILHGEPAVVAYFRYFFEKMCRQSHTFMTSIDGFLGNQAKWGQQYLQITALSNILEICSGLCSVQFWDETLIRKYINPGIPDCESVIKNYSAYVSVLYQVKKRRHTTVLMNASFVERFIQDGILREYPSIFFKGAISATDRQLLMNGFSKRWTRDGITSACCRERISLCTTTGRYFSAGERACCFSTPTRINSRSFSSPRRTSWRLSTIILQASPLAKTHWTTPSRRRSCGSGWKNIWGEGVF